MSKRELCKEHGFINCTNCIEAGPFKLAEGGSWWVGNNGDVIVSLFGPDISFTADRIFVTLEDLSRMFSEAKGFNA